MTSSSAVSSDLTQVQADGIVGVEHLCRDRLGLVHVGLWSLRHRCRHRHRLDRDLGGHGLEGLRLEDGDLGIELDRRGRQGGLGVGDRGSRGIEGNHSAPTDGVAPSRATSVFLTNMRPGSPRDRERRVHATRHT
jgi:hypothetical protein